MSIEGLENTSDDLSLFGSADPLVGKNIGGQWEITEFLGEGSMSVVYRAKDLGSGGIVVLKKLHPHLVQAAKNVKRFEQKAKTVANLRHHRVASFFDFYVSPEDDVYLVVDYMPGESLEDLLSKKGHLNVERAVEIFRQGCEGLEYAHNEGVLHRDLKPSNILLLETDSPKDDVKLVDFGVAKLLTEDGEEVKSNQYITKTREVFGSPLYMSPEQCMGKKLDARSDIYALGCVMYETVTGKPPFVGKNVLETAYKHMNEPPRTLASEQTPDPYLGRFESVVFKCLAKDPLDRYQSVSDLKEDLERLTASTEAEWLAEALALKKQTKVKRKEKRRSPVSFELAVFGCASVLLIAVVGIWSTSLIGSDTHTYSQFNNDLLWVVQNKKTAQTDLQDFGNREDDCKVRLSTIERQKGTNCKEYADALDQLIKLYTKAGHWADASMNLKRMIDVCEKIHDDKLETMAYQNLAYCAFMQNELDDAVSNAKEAVKRLDTYGMAARPAMIIPYKIMGDIYTRRGDLDKAAQTYQNLVALVEGSSEGNAVKEECSDLAMLADIRRRQHNYKEAEQLYKKSLDNYRDKIQGDNPLLAKILYGLGLTLASEGDFKAAGENFKEALPVARTTMPLGENDPLVGAIKKQYNDCLWKTNWPQALMAKFSNSDGSGK